MEFVFERGLERANERAAIGAFDEIRVGATRVGFLNFAQLSEVANGNDDQLMQVGMTAHPADEIKTDPRFHAQSEDDCGWQRVHRTAGGSGGVQMRLRVGRATQSLNIRGESLANKMLLERASLRVALFNQKDWT